MNLPSTLRKIADRSGRSLMADDRPVLRITQPELADTSLVELSLRSRGREIAHATTRLRFPLHQADRDDMRWYYEQRPLFRGAPGERVARIEQMLDEMGLALAGDVLNGNGECFRIWEKIRDRVGDLRIEVDAGQRGATMFPWELMLDPMSGLPFAIAAREFVRVTASTVEEQGGEMRPRLRVLLVISRPNRAADVPFRRVAHTLVHLFGRGRNASLEVEVLRPATFTRLKEVLGEAREQPFDIVHFDGHGRDIGTQGEIALEFESEPESESEHKVESKSSQDTLVAPERMADVLVKSGVRYLTLNACRSAFSVEVSEPPRSLDERADGRRAIVSLAERAMARGLHGVVAMRYNVFEHTAAHFVAALYRSLALGNGLGTAVNHSRRVLCDVAADSGSMVSAKDWFVPMVLEADLPTVDRERNGLPERFDVESAAAALSVVEPRAVGRDPVIHEIDRVFGLPSEGYPPIVVLHGLLGGGRTTVAADFADWYTASGGIEGSSVVATIVGCDGFDDWVRRLIEATEGIACISIDIADPPPSLPESVRHLARRLAAARMLVVVDDVEYVTGIPEAGGGWSAEERLQFSTMLRWLARNGAKVLLVSSRDESGWEREAEKLLLASNVRSVKLPWLVLADPPSMIRAVARRIGMRDAVLPEHWNELAWSCNHPVSLEWHIRWLEKRDETSVGGRFRAPIPFARNVFQPTSEGERRIVDRLECVVATLTDEEREVVALIHLCIHLVDVDVLFAMASHLELPFAAHHESKRDPYVQLIDRIAVTGLIGSRRVKRNGKEGGVGYYTIPMIVSLGFERLFAEIYPVGARRQEVLKAFVWALASIGFSASEAYDEGDRYAVQYLADHEANMLRALDLALGDEQWGHAIDLMQGFRALYTFAARAAEWSRLVEEMYGFVATGNGRPISGREQAWVLVQHWIADGMRAEGLLDIALPLFDSCIEQWRVWVRRGGIVDDDDDGQMKPEDVKRSLAAELQHRGRLLLDAGSSYCIDDLAESENLCVEIGDECMRAISLHLLARLYTGTQVSKICDLDKAERYCREMATALWNCDRAGDVRGRRVYHVRQDRLHVAHLYLQRSIIAYSRYTQLMLRGLYDEAQSALHQCRKEALYVEHVLAIDDLESPALRSRANNQLAIVSVTEGEVEEASRLWQKAANDALMVGDYLFAGQILENIGRLLLRHGDELGAREFLDAAERLMARANGWS